MAAALRKQFDLVVLGIVNGFAVRNPFHFLTTLVYIGDIDNRWQLSNCSVVKKSTVCGDAVSCGNLMT
jgi:hypothetical protein